MWTGQVLLDARAKLARAQHDSQEAFQTYTTSLELERQARQEVHTAEQRRDDLSELHLRYIVTVMCSYNLLLKCSRFFRAPSQ